MPSWWERNIVEPGKLPLLLCFVAFVATFLVARGVTRLIRAGRGPFHDLSFGGGGSDAGSGGAAASDPAVGGSGDGGGVHVHHAVPGLCLLVVGAFVAIGAPPEAPWRELAAVAIGIGASLVLDEFALILHLEDVYWSEQGQLSVQAVVVAMAYLGLVLVGVHPFGVDDVSSGELQVRLSVVGSVLLTLVVFTVCLAKGKYRMALVALFLPLIALVGAVRLARPGSWWFRRFYGSRPDARGQGSARAEAFDARWNPVFRRLGGAVAGTPTSP